MALAWGFPASSPARSALTRVQDAGAQQQVPHGRRLGVENLVHEVCGDRAVLGVEFLDELLRIGVPDQREGRQPDARRPALGAPGEALQGMCREGDAEVRQQRAGFGDAEGEVVSPDLGQLADQPVLVQWQQRVHPRRDHDVQAAPGVPQHVGQPFQRGGRGQQVQVVEDQQHGRVLGGQDRREAEQESVVDRARLARGR